MADFTIATLRGCLNDTDPPSSLSDDQVVEAMNVEFFSSMLGERRRGCTSVDLTSSNLASKTNLGFLFRHLPSEDETAAELWAFSMTPNAAPGVLARKTTAWTNPAVTDAINVAGTNGWALNGQSLHGKLFLAHKSAVDRLHCWDGTSIRRVGIAPSSAAPTSSNTGAGTYAGKRYHRVRFVMQVGGVTVLRSEPSPVLTTTPSGTGTGLVVTRPTAPGEAETHWELESSLNNADFYRIATTVLATTTSTDSIAYATGYAATGTLSDTSGDYTVPISPKYLSSDDDRLFMAGSYETAALASRVSWTPVNGDVTGVGNDERVPIATTNFLDLDGREGGSITGLSATLNGYVWVFKFLHIYKLVKSGVRTQAYNAVCLTKSSGALDGSVVEGLDQAGQPCLYFLDPRIGPRRIGSSGIQTCGFDVQVTWATVNINASSVVTRSLYYPNSKQVHWWIATNGSNTPNLKLVLQTNLVRDVPDGARKGFSKANGTIATAESVCLFATNIDANAARSLTLAPFIGTTLAGVAAILRCDTGIDDNGTAFYAKVTTKPYFPATILNKFGTMNGAILAKAAAGISTIIRLVRDFKSDNSEAVKDVTVSLAPVGAEPQVIVPMDNLALTELKALQISHGDLDTGLTPAGRWELNVLALKNSKEETA